MRTVTLTVSLILLAMLPPLTGNAGAVTISFDDVGLPSYNGQEYHNPIFQPGYLYPTPYGSTAYMPGWSDGVLNNGGFSFRGQHFHTIDRPGVHGDPSFSGAADSGSVYLNSELGDAVHLAAVDARPFSLSGFAAAECFVDTAAALAAGYRTAAAIRLSGTRADGSAVEAVFTLDGVNDGTGGLADFQAFELPPGWTDLLLVTFSGPAADGAPGGFSLEDVTAEAGPSVVTVSGRRLQVNRQPFTLRGVHYSPVPAGDDPLGQEPFGDYFTPSGALLWGRDLPLLRPMGANALLVDNLEETSADHGAFLEAAYNGGLQPIYVMPRFRIPADLDLDPLSPGNVREQVKESFRAMVAAHGEQPAILAWVIGWGPGSPGLSVGSPAHLFDLVEEMAAAAHAEEGVHPHPVVAELADENPAWSAAAREAATPSVDAWGFGATGLASLAPALDDFRSASLKPLLVLGWGIDAYDSAAGAEYESSGGTFQADRAADLWAQMAAAEDVCPGGAYASWSDEWWRGALSTDAGCLDADPAFHGPCGGPDPSQPDGYANDEWRGLVRLAGSGAEPDPVEPRAAYQRLQALWMPPLASLDINGGAPFTRTNVVTLGLTCRELGGCSRMQFSNDGVTWSAPAPFAPTRAWNLASGDGPKTVRARVMDVAGVWSGVMTSDIILDARPTITTASPPSGPYGSSVTVTLTCTDGTGSGCAGTFYTTDGSTPTAASEPYLGPLQIVASTVLNYLSVDRAGNVEAVRTKTYSLDPTPPSGSVIINGDAEWSRSRAVTLTLACSDNVRCYQMQISNDGGATWSPSLAYATSRLWPLSYGDGDKSVMVSYRDPAGNWSAPASDSIRLDSRMPLTMASPRAGTYGTDLAVTLTCSDTGSGCAGTFYTTDGSTPTPASAAYGGPIPLPASTTLKYLSMDAAGNLEAVRTQAYTVDPVRPTGTVLVNAGADWTRLRSVSLSMTCSDNLGCTQMRFSNDGVTWSGPVAFSPSRSWPLAPGDGPKEVRVIFRDTAGNWSDPASDAIGLDSTPPANGQLTAAAGAGRVSLAWSGFSDALSGLAGYTLVYGTAGVPACTSGTLLYSGQETSFEHEGLTAGALYYYRVCARDNAGNLAPGAYAGARPQ